MCTQAYAYVSVLELYTHTLIYKYMYTYRLCVRVFVSCWFSYIVCNSVRLVYV